MPPRPLPPTLQAVLEQAFALHTANRLDEAATLYRQILAAVPDDVDATRLMGTLAFQQGRPQEALDWLGRSLAVIPSQYEALMIQGNCWLAQRHFDAAVASYDKAIAFHPRFAEAWANRGDALRYLGRFDQAAASYERAAAFRPDLPWLPGMALYARLFLADWEGFDVRRAAVLERAGKGERVSGPLLVQTLTDDAALQHRAAEIFSATRFPVRGGLPAQPPFQRKDRIRVAYLSGCFHDHPVSHLTVGLFEHHDRSRFEVFAVSFGSPRDDPWQRRIRAAADRFIDASGLSDLDITVQLRDLGIDIAVDLDGHTDVARTAIFAERAAPIQVSYLGFPGSMGAPFIDYLLADSVLIPKGDERFYSETVVRLPCFQVNDDRLVAADRTFSRAELGLPDDAVVFCCFNQTYKLLPEVFDSWMRILSQVPGSVLWLYVPDPATYANLRREAEKRGVEGARLIFAARLPLEQHLTRLKQADLFLDTFPYNAGATASNALRMGVPVVTRAGEAFASRMGASLLTAVGLSDLIADTSEAYETLAIRLATEPEVLAEVRRRLADNLPGSPLFNTARVTQDIEAACEEMIDRLAQT